MSEELSVKRICVAGLYGGLLLVACVFLALGFPTLFSLDTVEEALGLVIFVLIFYLFFVPPTLFVIVRGNFRVNAWAAFLIGAVECSLVLLMFLPWETIVFTQFVVLPVASGLIGIFVVWYGGLLRARGGISSA